MAAPILSASLVILRSVGIAVLYILSYTFVVQANLSAAELSVHLSQVIIPDLVVLTPTDDFKSLLGLRVLPNELGHGILVVSMIAFPATLIWISTTRPDSSTTSKGERLSAVGVDLSCVLTFLLLDAMVVLVAIAGTAVIRMGRWATSNAARVKVKDEEGADDCVAPPAYAG